MTTTKATHTPGPLRVGDAGHTLFGPKQSGDIAPSPEMVAQRLKPANAARLALCWNTHDALVAACEACIDALDENERHMVTLGGHLTYLQTSARNRARAALALVEGGTK